MSKLRPVVITIDPIITAEIEASALSGGKTMLAVDIATVIPLTVLVVQREATIACYIDRERLIQPRRCIPHRFTVQSADLMLPSLLN